MSQNAGVDFVIGPIYSIGVCDYFTFEVCDYASVQLISIVSDVYENYACAELATELRTYVRAIHCVHKVLCTQND